MITMQDRQTKRILVLGDQEQTKKRILLDAGWVEVEATLEMDTVRFDIGNMPVDDAAFSGTNGVIILDPTGVDYSPYEPNSNPQVTSAPDDVSVVTGPVVISEADKEAFADLLRKPAQTVEDKPEPVERKRKAKGRKVAGEKSPAHTWMANLPDRDKE